MAAMGRLSVLKTRKDFLPNGRLQIPLYVHADYGQLFCTGGGIHIHTLSAAAVGIACFAVLT